MADIPICKTTFKLNDGQNFPAVGLGTWQGSVGSKDPAAMEASIIFALQSGYRLIDTAQIYGVEAIVGRAIRNSGVPRADITVVTKFWSDMHHDPAAALQISLRDLGVDYVDVFLMHWPWASTPAPEKRTLRIDQSPTFLETWLKMEPLVGPQCRSIGVSNFTQKTLDVLLAGSTVVPVVNQVELHALNPNHKLAAYCAAKNIHVMSWCTLGGNRIAGVNPILTNTLFTDIAASHGCSASCVSLSWVVQRGITVIPKSKTESRILENIKLVTLTEAEMDTLNNAYKTIGLVCVSDYRDFMYIEENGKRVHIGWTAEDFGLEDKDGNWLV